MQHVIYLHGFASSPGSKKANFFKAPLEARGAIYHIPDLNVPSFEKLTLTAMLEKVAETIDQLAGDAPVALIGSSMGGLTALHFLDHYRDAEAERVNKLVLLAPALDFSENRRRQNGDDWLQQWREAGSISYFNYAVGEERPVHYGLAEDMLRYDSYAVKLDLPTLIYHGRHDDVVDHQQSVRFAADKPNVTLHLLDDDHQLLAQTDTILQGMLNFLDL